MQLRFIEFAFHGIIEMKCRQAVAWRNGSIVHGSNQMNKKENIITRIFLIYKSLLIQILCLFDLLYDKKIRLRFGIVCSGVQTALEMPVPLIDSCSVCSSCQRSNRALWQNECRGQAILSGDLRAVQLLRG